MYSLHKFWLFNVLLILFAFKLEAHRIQVEQTYAHTLPYPSVVGLVWHPNNYFIASNALIANRIYASVFAIDSNGQTLLEYDVPHLLLSSPAVLEDGTFATVSYPRNVNFFDQNANWISLQKFPYLWGSLDNVVPLRDQALISYTSYTKFKTDSHEFIAIGSDGKVEEFEKLPYGNPRYSAPRRLFGKHWVFGAGDLLHFLSDGFQKEVTHDLGGLCSIMASHAKGYAAGMGNGNAYLFGSQGNLIKAIPARSGSGVFSKDTFVLWQYRKVLYQYDLEGNLIRTHEFSKEKNILRAKVFPDGSLAVITRAEDKRISLYTLTPELKEMGRFHTNETELNSIGFSWPVDIDDRSRTLTSELTALIYKRGLFLLDKQANLVKQIGPFASQRVTYLLPASQHSFGVLLQAEPSKSGQSILMGFKILTENSK